MHYPDIDALDTALSASALDQSMQIAELIQQFEDTHNKGEMGKASRHKTVLLAMRHHSMPPKLLGDHVFSNSQPDGCSAMAVQLSLLQGSLATQRSSLELSTSLGFSDDDEYRVRYRGLKGRYRATKVSHIKEVNKLRKEILSLQGRLEKLDAARAEAERNEQILAKTLQVTTSQVSSELMELCCEKQGLSTDNNCIVKDLIDVKLALAESAERQLIEQHEARQERRVIQHLGSKVVKVERVLRDVLDKT